MAVLSLAISSVVEGRVYLSIVTCAKGVVFSLVSVCLSVNMITQKLLINFIMKFHVIVGQSRDQSIRF